MFSPVLFAKYLKEKSQINRLGFILKKLDSCNITLTIYRNSLTLEINLVE